MMNTWGYSSEYTSIWSFPERGSWATHNPNYRGNFAPQVARNVIEMYSDTNQTVLDAMCGGGTTLIECKLLGRDGIGVDINPEAVALTKKSLDFNHTPKSEQMVRVGDAQDLRFIKDETVDLILTHPPYLNIIRYSDGIDGDLSHIGSVKKFCDHIELVAAELFRVLKPDCYCAILIGDIRRGRHFVPLAYRVMERFLCAGFVLKEDIIKAQHNCSATERWKPKAIEGKFYLIMHEHLFVFRKPVCGEDLSMVKDSK